MVAIFGPAAFFWRIFGWRIIENTGFSGEFFQNIEFLQFK